MPEERYLRGRATELGQQYDCNKITKAAIIEIGQTLQLEGLSEMPEGCELKDVLEDQSGEEYEDQPGKIILAYHYMLWRTASCRSCTLPRSCGESFVSPYLPLILEATQMPIEATTVFSGENRGDENDTIEVTWLNTCNSRSAPLKTGKRSVFQTSSMAAFLLNARLRD